MTVHPELESEQAYIDHAYECMEKMRERIVRFQMRGRNDYERDVFEGWREARIAALSDATSALCFGRLDLEAGDAWYIGRRHVEDASAATVVVDWRAPIAASFYRASPRDKMGLARRRQFLVEGRELLGISDDTFSEDGPIRGADVLAMELARERSGEMRDIVATIQIEQDLVIRSPLDGIVVVQGGPGTGKTAIGLHRASFLLYEHRTRLSRRGVLVVGPNRTFMSYIAQVLPSLGETAVRQLPIGGLGPSVPVRGTESPDVDRIKGDARMAGVIARAIDLRVRDLEADVELVHEATRFRLAADVGKELAERLRARGVPHQKAREVLREDLLKHLYERYVEAAGLGVATAPYDSIRRAVRSAPAFKRAIDKIWPSLSAVGVVRDLLTKPQRLAAAARGLLRESEQRLLHRVPAERERWTAGDMALLDEAGALIEGSPKKYGHIVVDEAQDLSPMQLRMLARRCPLGSMTVLGDLGQATGAWAHDSWHEVLDHLPSRGGARVEEITLGYRVAAPIMVLAAQVLADAAPHVKAPVSVRTDADPPEVVRVPPAEVAARTASRARDLTGKSGSIAVIVPSSLFDPVREALEAAEVEFGDAARDGIAGQVSLVDAAVSKGLEFDSVVLVEPALIAESGLRLLYVAMTRAMRTLVIVHAYDLPPQLERISAEGGAR